MTSDVPGGKPPGQVSPAVAALRESLTLVLDESRALRVDVAAAEKARRQAEAATRKTGHINMALTGVLAVLVALVLAIGWQNNRLATDVADTNKIMADCTTPGGACYEQGRARTDSAVSAVVRISVYVSQCGRLWPGESGPDYDRKLEQCVAAKLAQAARQTPAPAPVPGPSSTPVSVPSPGVSP